MELSSGPWTTQRRSVALDVWAFVLPALSFGEITVVGRLIVSEIVALALLPWLLSQKDRLRVPPWFVILWGAWLASQIMTDFVVETPIDDFARGSAAIAFTLTNFVAILALVSTPQRARLFALGLAAAAVVGYFVAPHPNAAFDPWKWALAQPIALAIVVIVSGERGFRSRWLPALAIGAFGVASIALGSRSLGGVALVTGGYLAVNYVVGRRRGLTRPSISRAFFGLFISVALAFTILFAYDYAAAAGVLGRDAQVKYQSQAGSLGVLVGGRPAILASTQAIIDSPVLGHGSWAKDADYVAVLADRLAALGYALNVRPSESGLIPSHSHLFGAWVQSGFLGGLFWLSILGVSMWLLLNLYAVRLSIAPLLVFGAVGLIWSVLFSPYGHLGRIYAPYEIALVLVGLRLLTAGAPMGLSRGVRVHTELRPAGAGED